MQKIDKFIGQHFFLSNFFPVEIVVKGRIYRTVEHYFQAAKTEDPDEHDFVCQQLLPADAKREGQKVVLRTDWEGIKDEIMLAAIRAKFEIPAMNLRLQRTQGYQLIEGNTWGDRYWGVVKGEGQNRLGQLLMQVRAENHNNGQVVLRNGH